MYPVLPHCSWYHIFGFTLRALSDVGACTPHLFLVKHICGKCIIAPKIIADPNKSRTIIRDEGKSVAVRVGEVATAKDKLLLERHEMMEQGF